MRPENNTSEDGVLQLKTGAAPELRACNAIPGVWFQPP